MVKLVWYWYRCSNKNHCIEYSSILLFFFLLVGSIYFIHKKKNKLQHSWISWNLCHQGKILLHCIPSFVSRAGKKSILWFRLKTSKKFKKTKNDRSAVVFFLKKIKQIIVLVLSWNLSNGSPDILLPFTSYIPTFARPLKDN